jgi:hypothetical protein
MSVLFELSALGVALETAVEERSIRRSQLERPWWDRHGPDLVNYLPAHMVKALHVLHDDFDTLRFAYSLLMADVDQDTWKGIASTFVGWDARVRVVTERINEYNRRLCRLGWPGWVPWAQSDVDRFLELARSMDDSAAKAVRNKGLDPQLRIRLPQPRPRGCQE